MSTTTTTTTIKELILLRGLPGSGKSTLAKQILQQTPALSTSSPTHIPPPPTGVILSTDDYFTTPNGYTFVPQQLSIAHAWNQSRARQAASLGITPIIIDNTHVKRWEAKAYVKIAMAMGYSVTLREPLTDWWLARDTHTMALRNTHGVSEHTIVAMMAKWDTDYTINTILES
ncbi:hypothetical protein BASA50_010929 [Batrachochytrium salamandrivorans]|uniref:P-loop containing nucleoside triphosphate hydrolase protein n=1 Tax=Batrachochytrium salamandrivorans TaxID=1357716 RepID=A0ABQ8EX44_9FUNG|nr:hypothetical protein BASA60_009928 [Batrachochytrium salamandrivorans]KAH6588066.1 hypothetical protein BASA50_010929 [Batrachochytrium salamandrivorans]KAH9252683.1 hypothetical protein BASA81_009375 [Batrachochytrium salamandrivorans]KAH9267515.1 hypothetical protein BASA83_009905 [Batrachochytrium salamandrivorans]KAJ1340219.1 hypothetical protein BSLG_005212 [Batrachochytrium salamandrivorans]